jgi:hypothetical protein
MSDFISPYQFIDVTGRVNGGERADLDYDDIKKGRTPFTRHDLWHKDSHSGRLICRLTLETPTFVGNEQFKPEDPHTKAAKQVEPLRLDNKIALPATSLRGMIAATAEALSQSALRILDNIDYGVRQDAGEGTNVKLGQITPGSEPGDMKIRPFDCCHIRTADAEAFWESSRSRTCYADLSQSEEKPGRCGRLLNGASALSATATDRHTTPGQLLILEFTSEDARPETRKYEIFAYQGSSGGRPPLEIAQDAIDAYEHLFAERAIATRDDDGPQPFCFRGLPKDDQHPWRLHPGQFVYYRDDGSQATEIRPSQIWRAKAGTSHDYFARIDPNLLPWGAPARKGGLSPAEALFGVVEREKSADKKSGRNLAGRVRFSAGRFFGEADPLQLPEITLKILSSPKPPSPAMYFHNKGERGQYLSRTKMASGYRVQQAGLWPNGRKVYIHHREQDIKQEPWRSRNDQNDHQKLSIRPLKDGQAFYFHIDFDNLSRYELDLLLTAIRPAAEHRHRLGLGKPLGLGTVRLDICACCLRDSAGRYTAAGLTAPRYGEVWQEIADTTWHPHYAAEATAIAGAQTARPAAWQLDDNPLIDRRTRDLMATLGDPGRVQLPVQAPLTAAKSRSPGAEQEQETFEWFVQNDAKGQEYPQALPEPRAGEPVPGMDFSREPVKEKKV